jgi:hypothetical protein
MGKLVYQSYQETVFIEIAVYADAMRFKTGCVAIVAKNGLSFTGDGEMDMIMLQVLKYKLRGVFGNIPSDCVERRLIF